MKDMLKPKELLRTLGTVCGMLLYSAGMNLFVVPSGIYSGGIMGICQIIRTVLIDYLHFPFTGFDIAGIIYYIVNIPIIFMAYKIMGKMFLSKTVLCMTVMTIFLSVIPIPTELLIAGDTLTSCLIGGILTGVGCGIALICGGSSGGMDVIGIYIIKKFGNSSVGKLNLMLNAFVYTVCLFLFDEQIVIYSLIFAAVASVAVDRIHAQNINAEVIIITKKYSKEMQTEILTQLGRGITKWDARGAYTQEGSEIWFIVLSKYEINQMKRIIHKYDKDAFIVVKEGVHVEGNYLRKL